MPLLRHNGSVRKFQFVNSSVRDKQDGQSRETGFLAVVLLIRRMSKVSRVMGPADSTTSMRKRPENRAPVELAGVP